MSYYSENAMKRDDILHYVKVGDLEKELRLIY